MNAHKQNNNNIINSPPVPTNSSDEVPGQGHEAGRISVQPTEQCTIQNPICKRKPEPDPLVVGCASNLSLPIRANTKEERTSHSSTGKVTTSLSGKPRRKQKTKKRSDPAHRKKWSNEDNITLMLAYYQSQPGKRGYRKRLFTIWTASDNFTCTEQQLADQVRSVITNKLLSDMELYQVQLSAVSLEASLVTQDQHDPISPFASAPASSPQASCPESELSFTIPPPTPPRAHSTPVQPQLTSPPPYVTLDSEISFNLPVTPHAKDTDYEPSLLSQTISELRAAAENPPPPPAPSPPPAPNAPPPEHLPEDLSDIRKQLIELMEDPAQIQMKPLRHVDLKKLKAATARVNKVVDTIVTANLTETNTLLKAAAHIVREHLGEKMPNQSSSNFKDPHWKRRIEDKIKENRKDLSHLKILQDGGHLKKKISDGLHRRHPLLKKKGLKTITEELKQRVRAKAAKIQRFKKRCDRYRDGQLFRNNQRQFYRNLSSETSTDLSDTSEDQVKDIKDFWQNIWGTEAVHNTDASWIPHVKDQLNSQSEDQSPFAISDENLRARVKKMANWSSPGNDGLHAFWLKHLSSTHSRIAIQLQECITLASVPVWMTTGKTFLLVKDPDKGMLPGNFRPITCLPIMWKLLTGLLSGAIYDHLLSHSLFPDEQKGCRSMSRGCKEQLLIDKLILKNCKRRKTNLHMAFIDYKKAYDRIPHSWILECLRWCKVDPKIISLFEATFQQCTVQLHLGKQSLGSVKVLRGIFQGDAISPLQFIIGLIPLSLLLKGAHAGYRLSKDGPSVNHRLYMDDLKLYGRSESELDTLLNITKSFSDDIKMEFGIDKCASVTIKKGQKISTEGVTLPDGTTLQDVKDEGYRYLGILEADKICNAKMKEVTERTYLQRVKKLLKSQLDGKSTFQAINTWAVPVIRYSAGILDWTKNELQDLDRKTRKKLKLSGSHHPQADVDRLYIPRKAGGRGLQSVEEVVYREENALTTFIDNSTSQEIIALKPHLLQEKILRGQIIDKDKDKDRDHQMRTEDWKKKTLHGKYPAAVDANADPVDTWEWLHRSDLKRETEGLLVAAQDQALRTNWIKSKIDKDGSQPLCRLCFHQDETIDHVLSGCSKLAQQDYKARHDKVAAALHWNLCKKYHFDHHKQWYNHHAEKVLENESVKLLWDFHIQTDHKVEHCRPDLILVDKKKKEALIIDVAVPGDTRIKKAEQTKIEKYQDLKRELKKIWHLRDVKVIPVVIGALGAVTSKFKEHLKSVHCPFAVSTLQKTALLGSAHILRKVLDI